MKGKLFGIGVGPGDPELLTLKAVRRIQASGVVAVPGKDYKESIAYKIAAQELGDMADKVIIAIDMPMTKDKSILEESHEAGARRIVSYLNEGKDVAFLTLGDPTVYSTYIYVHQRVIRDGYKAEIISGIPSFCAVAARLNTGLVEKSESLHIVPASYDVKEALGFSGTKVLMKSGKKIGEVRNMLLDMGLEACMIENCGMENEKIYRSVSEIPDNIGYYASIIVKEEK